MDGRVASCTREAFQKRCTPCDNGEDSAVLKIKHDIKAALSTDWGWRLSSFTRPAGVVVLTYHQITEAGDPFEGTGLTTFREQMCWLRRHCTPIGPEDFPEMLHSTGRRKPAVLVTFDDGYRDYHNRAYPVLSELKIPAVVFLATAFIGTTRMMWTDAVSWAFRWTRRVEIVFPWDHRQEYRLGTASERQSAERLAKGYLKTVSDEDRSRWQAQLIRGLEVDSDDGSAGRQMLSWGEVRATREYTYFGGHSHTHPILSQLPPEAADEEIRLCRDRIEEETGHAPKLFAYPNGRAQDFSECNKQSLQRHGFDLGFSTIDGINGPDIDRYAIRRRAVWPDTITDFSWLVANR